MGTPEADPENFSGCQGIDRAVPQVAPLVSWLPPNAALILVLRAHVLDEIGARILVQGHAAGVACPHGQFAGQQRLEVVGVHPDQLQASGDRVLFPVAAGYLVQDG